MRTRAIFGQPLPTRLYLTITMHTNIITWKPCDESEKDTKKLEDLTSLSSAEDSELPMAISDAASLSLPMIIVDDDGDNDLMGKIMEF